MEKTNAHLAEFWKQNPKSTIRTSISDFGPGQFLVMFVKFSNGTNSYYKTSIIMQGNLTAARITAVANMPRGSVEKAL